jgi:hypothetical protein
MEDLELA